MICPILYDAIIFPGLVVVFLLCSYGSTSAFLAAHEAHVILSVGPIMSDVSAGYIFVFAFFAVWKVWRVLGPSANKRFVGCVCLILLGMECI